MSNWLKISAAGVVVLLCLAYVAKDFLPPSEPKFVPAINYDQLLSLNQTPCVVYFYHNLSDNSVRAMMPAFDELASRFKDRLGFYRYQLSNPEEKLPQKMDSESTFSIYDGGKEIRNFPVRYLANRIDDNEGLILLMLKDYLVANNSDFPHPQGTPYVTAEDFQQRVLECDRPVIVDFTSATCPPCLMLAPQFKQIATKNSNLADFYFFDNDLPANRSIVHQYHAVATPTVMLFYKGESQGSFSGAFSISSFNEGRILWLLQPFF